MLNVNDNQKTLKEDSEDYVKYVELKETMDSAKTTEKNKAQKLIMSYSQKYSSNTC